MRQSKKIRRKSWFGMMAGIAACAVLLAACVSQPENGAAPADAAKEAAPLVKTAVVKREKIGLPAELIAEIAPSVSMDVMPKGGGEVTAVLKKRGDRVKRGEVIARLDDSAAHMKKKRAELAIRSAESLLEQTEEKDRLGQEEVKQSMAKLEREIEQQTKELNRLKNGYDEGTVEKAAVDQAELQLKNSSIDLAVWKMKLEAAEHSDSKATAREQLETARLELLEAGMAIDEARIAAPTDGILTEWTPQPGMMLSQGGTIGRIVQLDPVLVRAKLPEDLLPLAEGKSSLAFYVSGSPEQTYKGSLAYLSEVMDTRTRTYDVELRAANGTGALKPGMKVRIRLETEAERLVPAVPASAVIRDESKTSVFVYQDGKAVRQEVELGPLQGTLYAVTDGLKEGDTVIVTGQHRLKENEPVSVEPPSAKPQQPEKGENQ
ncbi:efflux RND transporter periplasmic adaptor subunit [Paenibacillus thiaminolyticus]|uniref:efflux RND transporter periplasmic adaptor subunit n=1 Tax=Paenibacillus thiaminolyticus TaxID=49283 RepID=UPI001165A633|nr:efflux RND transporter periplasmic adaptor subunit [Paenibacillus thiaminolyticus]NGP60231.1 efflux RND transporter periplasmic adaptor subunit [Paenibacillus thiaminolyticus]WCR26127.1 efflux RND transporter periplasmic adaptor subunit [Paenibacillus thiaminolyticus]